MSNRAIDAVKDFSQSKGSVRLLMFVIADGVNKSTGVYEAKVQTLVNECNCSERWVQKLVSKALALGELVIFEREGHNSAFAIPIYPGELGYDPQPCEDDTHLCLGKHTPLSVDRETARRDQYQQNRRQQKTRRKLAAQNDSSPPTKTAKGVNDSTPPGEREFTPVRTIVHPRVNASSPNTHIDTPSITPVMYQGHSTITLEKPEDADADLQPAPGAWTAALHRLGKQMTAAQMQTWLRPLKLFDGPGGYVLIAHSHSAAEQVSRRYLDRIRLELGAPVEVRVRA